ncbi:MAG: hypothetical protein WBC44_10670 [Planctomycetaceae bacterium]
MTAMSWLDRLGSLISSHINYYVWFVVDQWNHMTPAKYTGLLVSIAVVGLLLMGRGNKRT